MRKVENEFHLGTVLSTQPTLRKQQQAPVAGEDRSLWTRPEQTMGIEVHGARPLL